MSSHPEPLFGEAETLSTLVILPEQDVRPLGDRLVMLVGFLQAAEQQYRVDAPIVFEFPPVDDRNVETMDALEFKWRPRACLGIPDHSAKDLEPAGFLEVHR